MARMSDERRAPNDYRWARQVSALLLNRRSPPVLVPLLLTAAIVLTSNTYGHVLEQRQQEMARAMEAVLGG
jgi:hypothetical protein